MELRETLPGSWLDASGGCFTGAAGTGLIRAEERFDMRGHLAMDRQRAHGGGGDWLGGGNEGGPWLGGRGGRVGQRALSLGVPVNQRSIRPQTVRRLKPGVASNELRKVAGLCCWSGNNIQGEGSRGAAGKRRSSPPHDKEAPEISKPQASKPLSPAAQ